MAGHFIPDFKLNSSVGPEKLPIKVGNGLFKMVAMATILVTRSESFGQVVACVLIGRNLHAQFHLPELSGFRENHDTAYLFNGCHCSYKIIDRIRIR